MSFDSSIAELAQISGTTRIRIRNTNTLRDYLVVHRKSKEWVHAVDLENGMMTDLLTSVKSFFLLSTKTEIEHMRTLAFGKILEMLMLNSRLTARVNAKLTVNSKLRTIGAEVSP